MAILLIKADAHWMDALTEEEVQKYASKDLSFMDSYNARYQKGDVVEVREDGCPFGNSECLPKFLVVKVDGKKSDWLHLMTPETEDQLKFDDQKMESYVESKTILRRKYEFPIEALVSKTKMDTIKASESMVIDTYDSKSVLDKTILVIK